VPADPTDADRETAMRALGSPDVGLRRPRPRTRLPRGSLGLSPMSGSGHAHRSSPSPTSTNDPLIGLAVALAIRAAAQEDPK
jgi:hypothetical protein